MEKGSISRGFYRDRPVAISLTIEDPDPAASPLIVRISGLPGSALTPLSSLQSIQQVGVCFNLSQEVEKIRAQLIDLVFRALPGKEPSERRTLLEVKRDCFNQRSLRRYRTKPIWAELQKLSGFLCDRLLELEEIMLSAEGQFECLYRAERDRERKFLYGLLSDQRFTRGIALGSPILVQKVRALTGECDGRGLARKAELSLLRFASRASAKLSPYSTLTTVALGDVTPGKGGVEFLGVQREVALIRINRSLVDQCEELLKLYSPFREYCLVRLNETVRMTEESRCIVMRPSRWELDAQKRKLRFMSASYVQLSLSGWLPEALSRVLSKDTILYKDLLERIREELGGEAADIQEGISSHLEYLASIGYIEILPPWPTNAPHLEHCMLECLHNLPTDPALQQISSALTRLLQLAPLYQSDDRPEVAAGELKKALEDVLSSTASLHEEGAGIELFQRDVNDFYEDVLSLGEEGGRQEVVRVGQRDVDQILNIAEQLLLFANLFNHRHDFLNTLAYFWSSRWPQDAELGCLEVFREILPIWKKYVAFDLSQRNVMHSCFNPFNLFSTRQLQNLRIEIYKDIESLIRPGPGGDHLPIDLFSTLLKRIPGQYAPVVGACLFVQPIENGFWVLNRLFEGTGRYSSRFHVPMEREMRKRQIDSLTARSTRYVDGTSIQFLDLMFSRGNTSNPRFPQTMKVLEMPGERIDLPRNRRVSLQNLRIKIDFATGAFQLTGPEGQVYLPVHLSALSNLYMPAILRFLSMFGPSEVRQVLPRGSLSETDCSAVHSRLTCENLVIGRKRWETEVLALRAEISTLSDSESFMRIHAWRRSRGIDLKVFVFEQVGSERKVFKPQYIDFSSPSFVTLFRSIVSRVDGRLIIEEALPQFGSFISDSRGESWATELQIDSLCLQPVG